MLRHTRLMILFLCATVSAHAQVRRQVEQVIGEASTGLVPDCSESPFATLGLYLPRLVYNTGSNLVTSRLLKRVFNTPYGLCQTFVDPVAGLDTLSESLLNPLATVNDAANLTGDVVLDAFALQREPHTSRIELASHHTVLILQSDPLIRLACAVNPFIHYQFTIDGEPLPIDGPIFRLNEQGDRISLASNHPADELFEFRNFGANSPFSIHFEHVHLTTGEPEAVVIQKLLNNHLAFHKETYNFLTCNCTSFVRAQAEIAGLSFPTFPNLGLGGHFGTVMEPDPEVLAFGNRVLEALRNAVISLEITGTLSGPLKTEIKTLFGYQGGFFVWPELAFQVLESAHHARNFEIFQWLAEHFRPRLFWTVPLSRDIGSKLASFDADYLHILHKAQSDRWFPSDSAQLKALAFYESEWSLGFPSTQYQISSDRQLKPSVNGPVFTDSDGGAFSADGDISLIFDFDRQSQHMQGRLTGRCQGTISLGQPTGVVRTSCGAQAYSWRFFYGRRNTLVALKLFRGPAASGPFDSVLVFLQHTARFSKVPSVEDAPWEGTLWNPAFKISVPTGQGELRTLLRTTSPR